jgi:very-short-patch-repair endonuclease
LRRRGAGGEVVALARQLRKKQTPAEQILWARLRDRRLAGLKFRRQHPIDKFIADFYCHEARLVVEVDGVVHREKNQVERDALRTEALRQFGLSVVRVTNTEVETALREVLSRIVRAAQAGIKPLTPPDGTPLLLKGGGPGVRSVADTESGKQILTPPDGTPLL